MNKLLAQLSPVEQKLLKKKKMPTKIDPMLATLTHDRFYDNKNWVYERKLDGERCIAFKDGKKVTLKSRNNLDVNTSYPEVQEAISKLKADKIILDGEVVAFKNNVSDFERLQSRMHVRSKKESEKKGMPIYYYIFDILYLDGYDLTKLPFIKRKYILKEALTYKKPLRFTRYLKHESSKNFKDICKKGWEGWIVKRLDATYQENIRSKDWLKFKCVADQELVIGGYTEPGGSRIGFGALLLGYYKNNKLHYAGKVGTGFNEQTLQYLYKKMSALETHKNPFSNYNDSMSGIHWIKPKLVCEIAFSEWTKGNKLRHPRYQGLRRDKAAKDVVKEQ